MRPMVSASVPSRSNRTTGQRCEVTQHPRGVATRAGPRVHEAATDATARTAGASIGFPAAPHRSGCATRPAAYRCGGLAAQRLVLEPCRRAP